MTKLLYKELRLAAHPTLYMFMLLGALVLVPAYPYGMVFMFGCLAPFITFMFGRETNDVTYTALLPVKKSDVVKGKLAMVVFVQLFLILVSVACAFFRRFTVPMGNPVGMEANVAYYGFGLAIFAVFNAIFFAQFYKTAYKLGKPVLLAGAPALLLTCLMEVLPHLRAFAWIDSTAPADMLRQLPILLLGLVLYPLGVVLAYRLGSRNFAKVDL